MGQDESVGYATRWFLLWLNAKEHGCSKLLDMPYSLDVEMSLWMLGEFPSYRDVKMREMAGRQ